MIVTERPDTIIGIGDWGCFDSLSSYDARGSRNDINQNSLVEECMSVRESLKILFAPLKKLEKEQARRAYPYRPRKIITAGNHEERKERLDNLYPHWAPAIDIWELCGYRNVAVVGQTPFLVYPYKHVVEVDGINYVHIPYSKGGRPFGGVNVARTVALSSERHTIFGHTHNSSINNVPVFTNENAVRFAFNIASFLPHQQQEPYCQGDVNGWQYMVAKVWPSGDSHVAPDVETVQVWRLKEQYS